MARLKRSPWRVSPEWPFGHLQLAEFKRPRSSIQTRHCHAGGVHKTQQTVGRISENLALQLRYLVDAW